MINIGEINITLQLFGSILSLMIILCLFLGGNAKTKMSRLYVLLLVLNMGGLLFDALAYVFRGGEGTVAFFDNLLNASEQFYSVLFCPLPVCHSAERAVYFTVSKGNLISSVRQFLYHLRIIVCVPFVKIVINKTYFHNFFNSVMLIFRNDFL